MSATAQDAIVPQDVVGVSLNDPNLKVELLDSHPDEFFLSHDMDLAGRLYLGAREGVFVYERTADGGFQDRKELYRFPKDTWVYDLEALGDELLVLTNTALYRLLDPLDAEPTLEKILWGNPLGHHHQGLHGMEFAPDGGLLICMGDPHPGVHLDKNRPDHLWLWTWYVGPDNRPVPYAGVGAVMRLDLENYDLSVYASGLRNPCGISFDRDWNLFANDNDQEGSTANPCKLVSVPRYSWNGWARGWDSSQVPGRLDMIPNVNWSLDVPVGQGFYDHATLGEEYRGSLFVANWGSRSVDRYPIQPAAAGFRSESLPFLQAEGDRRPVSAMPTNDGRLIVSICYMQGNEGSPQRQTDLLLISPREAGADAAFDHSDRSLVELLSEPVQLRAKAHSEMLRRGCDELDRAASAFAEAEPDSPAFGSLVFLAAANGDARSVERITALATGNGPGSTLAWRAAAAFPDQFSALSEDAINSAAAKRDQPSKLTGPIEFLHSSGRSISDSAATLAAHDDAFVRQAMAILLARRAPAEQLDRLAGGTAEERLAATLATSFRIWEQAEKVIELPKGSEVAVEKRTQLLHPDGAIDLRDFGSPIGTFTMAQWWLDAEVRKANQADFARLKKALTDAESRVASTAATGLFFLNDNRVEPQVASVLAEGNIKLSIAAAGVRKKDLQLALKALKGAKLPSGTEIPEAFQGINWDGKSAPKGDVEKGKVLFTQRGCVACHLAPHDGAGGSIGPTMVGIGERFPPSYLAASILVPNLTVSPNFHPNTITMKDGTTHTGFVEPGAAEGKVKLRIITGQLIELAENDIAKQNASEQSMMPAGLVQTPTEMADLIAFLRAKPGGNLPAAAGGEEAAFVAMDSLEDWETAGNWQVDEEGVFVLTPRAGEVDWKRYGHYLWSKQPYRDFVIEFEYKHEAEGNSGLYFNVTDRENAVSSVIEIQIRDSADEEELNAHAMSGGILPGVAPTANSAKPAGEWNHMKVRSLEGVVTVTLNGELVNRVKLTYQKLKGKPKEGFIGFQDHGLPFWLRNIRIRDLATSSPGEPEDPLALNVRRRIDGTQPSTFHLAPTEAKFVRVDVLKSSRGQPCIDELEIFSAGSPQNLALQSGGAKATASSLLKGHPEKHRIEFLNDGRYGNTHSWIPAQRTGWAQIELPEAVEINRVVLSRDRGGQIADRTPVSFDILVSMDGKKWQTVKKVRPPSQANKPEAEIIRPKAPNSEHGAEAKPKPAAARGEPNPDHPNIVLILADDFGWGDTSCNNPDSPIQTPQIDRIAAEGIRFTNAHTPSAVCTPTRYGLLTGRYPWRSYLKSQVLAYYAPALIPEGRTTIASYLRSQGYRTGGFGKWHIGLDWTPVEGDPTNWRSHWKTRDPKVGIMLSKGIDHTKPFKNAPTDIGFDTYFGTPSNAGRLPFFIHDNQVAGNPQRDKQGMMRDPSSARDKVDDIYVDKAIAFIETNEKNHPENPFFVYLPLNAIHGAVKVPARFEGKTGMTKREDKILWADESVGRVLDSLDRMKLTDDTLVIFTTDNGPLNSPTARENGHEPTGPYRGFKTGAWDGGTRVPFAARWPDRIPADAASDHLIGLVDMLATFAELCGEPLPEGAGPDSVSQLAAILQDKENITPRPAMVTATYRGLLALRQGEWKAIFGTKWSGGHTNENYGGLGPDKTMDDPESGQLYNLEKDPEEQTDLWESHPEVVQQLLGELDRIQQLEPSDEPPVR